MNVVALTSDPNQSINALLTVDGAILHLGLNIHYNEIASYWVMDIFNDSGNALVYGIPLVTGYYPAANLLSQFSYLKVGSAYLVCVSPAQMIAQNEDYPSWQPGNNELGTDFVLLWGDTAA